jgi:methionyl-tRNA formyltransferase
MVQPTLLAAGYRGTVFLAGILDAGLHPERVISYRQAGDRSLAFERLMELAKSKEIPFEENKRPDLTADKLVFIVGWQFLLSSGNERCVVFHDSLLPKYRGFAPTVTALLCGDNHIGVTAFRPDAGTDTGALYGVRAVHPPAGATLQSVLDLQTNAMIALALDIADRMSRGALRAVPQEGESATYSLWRDTLDFFIDWRQDAPQVLRHIVVSGFPYEGAKAVLGDRILTILTAHLGPEIDFAVRDPGKLWQIENGRALVVCGKGTVWIDEAVDADRIPFRFEALRNRFLTADTAWIAPVASLCRTK